MVTLNRQSYEMVFDVILIALLILLTGNYYLLNGQSSEK